MGHPIRFGIQTGQQNVAWAELLDLWRSADAWGYDSLWNFDHFYPIFTGPDGPCLEGWTTLAALAQATTRARIGHLVCGNTYRHPCVTAKSAATVDHISNGRLNLGLGAGWYELEHRNFGIDYKSVRGRLDALDEACRIIKGMFRDDKTTVHGEHYTVTDARGLPRPVQPHGVPILIGGAGKKVLLRLVAEHADLWNTTGRPERFADLISVLRRHGEAVGRDIADIEKTVMMPLCYSTDPDRQQTICNLFAAVLETTPEEARRAVMIGGKDECLEQVERYRKVGVTHFIFMTFVPYLRDEMQAFAEEVAPAARA